MAKNGSTPHFNDMMAARGGMGKAAPAPKKAAPAPAPPAPKGIPPPAAC